MQTARQIANKQLSLYNAKDIDGFCALFADNVQLIDLPSMSVFVSGQEALRKFYIQRFSNPNLHCVVHSQSDIGQWAIDKETVHGLETGVLNILAMYEVIDEKIQRAFFIKE